MKKYDLILTCFQLLLSSGMAQPARDTIKPEFSVSPLEKVNTRNNEFGAVPYGSNILFVAPQPKDMVNNSSPTDVNGAPYTDVYQVNLKDGRVKNISPFSAAAINSPWHDGPVTFSKDQAHLFLTRVEYKSVSKKFTNKGKLVEFEKKAGNWWPAAPFPYNDDNWSVGHACLSDNGLLLFFSSDMPGGYGGKDIYLCRKTRTGWGNPENLGPGVNTTGDEIFPFIRQDGLLFFSSTAHGSIGGLDIFCAHFFNGAWRFKKSAGEPLNSKWDDFGLVFADAVNGYFSSNREGGEGGDDIYRFVFKYSGVLVRGRLLLTDDLKKPAKNTLVYLMDSEATRIDSLHTDNSGAFEFRNIYGVNKLMISVEPEDPEMKEKARFYLANDNDEVVRISQPIKENKFVFKNLPVEKSLLQELRSGDDLTLAGVLSYSNTSQIFISNVKINLINTYGDVVETATTNELGSFVFRNIPPDQHYIVEIPEEEIKLPYGTTVTLSDKNGKRLKQFVTGREAFRFKLLPPEKYSLSELAVDENVSLDHNGCFHNHDPLRPVSGKIIYLTDAKNKLLDSVRTNANGFFKFRNLKPDGHYTAYFETSDESLTNKSGYYLKDKNDRMVRTAYLSEGRKHIFRNVPSDSASLQMMKFNNRLTLAGRLHYGDKGDIPLENIRVRLMDEHGHVIDSIPANGSGCFIFRNLDPERSYLLDMNESDLRLPANTRVIMADCNGKIIKTFYVGKDKFEFKILPAEKNLMPDLLITDGDLSISLTGFIFGENRRPLAHIRLTLRDSTGKEKEVIETASNGKFTFRSLREDLASLIELVKDTSDAVLYIADSKGRIYKRVVLNNGRFEYKLLDVDRAWMGEFNVDDPWLQVTRMGRKTDSVTIIENIYYAVNDFRFDSLGRRRIDKAIYAMKANSHLKLEVGSHTDSRANDGYNLELSNKRARYAVEYIISQGINPDRISGIGYGEKKLLNRCSNNVNCPDSEHARNRRTEFKLTYEEEVKTGN